MLRTIRTTLYGAAFLFLFLTVASAATQTLVVVNGEVMTSAAATALLTKAAVDTANWIAAALKKATDTPLRTKALSEAEAQQCRDAVVDAWRKNKKKCKDNKAPHWHHIFPKELIKEFLGIKVIVDEFTIPLCAEDHIGKNGIHNGETDYNGRWIDFFYGGGVELTMQAAVDLANELLDEAKTVGEMYSPCPYPYREKPNE